jgi:hypothetical protein
VDSELEIANGARVWLAREPFSSSSRGAAPAKGWSSTNELEELWCVEYHLI